MIRASLMALAVSAFPGSAIASEGVELCHIANAGFLIEGRHESVLVDGLLGAGSPNYPVASPELVKQIANGEGRFARVRLGTISHHHRDHFDGAATMAHLEANPDAEWLLTPQAVKKSGIAHERITTTLPDWNGPSETFTFGGITVETWRVDHGANRPIENLGLKITIDNVSFFHPGDISTNLEQLQKAGLDNEPVDVLLVPYWYGMYDADDLAELEASLDWRIAVPMHYGRADAPFMKDDDLEELNKRALATFPGAIDLRGEMQCITVTNKSG